MKLFPTLLALTIITSSMAEASDIPESWILIPEEAPVAKFSNENSEAETPKSGGVSKILSAQLNSLEKAETRYDGSMPWRFVAFLTDIGLSFKRSFGTVAFKGSPSVTIQWEKKLASAAEPVSFDKADTLSLDPYATPENQSLFLEEVTQRVMSTRKIDNEDTLRNSLKEHLNDARVLSQYVDAAGKNAGWEANRLRFDLAIEASGKVHFAASAAAEIQVRLEWLKKTPRSGNPTLAASKTNMALDRESLTAFLESVTQDLSVLSENPDEDFSSFALDGFKIGLGISQSGKAGAAKTSVKAVAHIYFGKKKGARVQSLQPLDGNFLIIDSSPSLPNLQYAETHALLLEKGESEATYRASREQFRNGLKKAKKMASYFALEAKDQSGKNWKIRAIKPGFSISLTGMLGMPKLTSSVSGALTLKHKNF